jgi:hypothetical protein
MPRITVQPVNSEGEPRRWTLSERIVAENLNSDHYIAQLIERLLWATVDAEAVEVATTPGVKPSLASGPIGRGATDAPMARVRA